MKKIYYITVVMAVLILSSCGTLDKAKSFGPNDVRLNIGMDDLVYVGQVEVNVSYRTYLGFIRVIDQINGEDYSSFTVKKADFDNHAGVALNGPIRKATYKAMETYPEATYFMPVYKTVHKNRLFLGNEITTTAIIRAYKFK